MSSQEAEEYEGRHEVEACEPTPLRRVPPSFATAKERKRSVPKLDQLALCDEPDHTPEQKARANYKATRGWGKPSTFADAVRRRREAGEAQERRRLEELGDL